MKKGDTVTIFDDPYTERQIEGKAKLIRRIPFKDSQIERWLVRFENGDTAERFIRIGVPNAK